MATTPEQIRSGLHIVADAAAADVAAAAEQAETPSDFRAVLFAVAPAAVAAYGPAAAALGAEWYEELRDAAAAIGDITRPFVPTLVLPETEDKVKAIVATASVDFSDRPEAEVVDFEEAKARILRDIEDATRANVAEAMRQTVVENVTADPDASGWRRFARPGACKFCRMLADRGAVYTRDTVRFAAHGAVMPGGRKGGNCMCFAGPAFGKPDEEATALQYAASRKKRTAKQRAALRKYLNENFPDAPG